MADIRSDNNGLTIILRFRASGDSATYHCWIYRDRQEVAHSSIEHYPQSYGREEKRGRVYVPRDIRAYAVEIVKMLADDRQRQRAAVAARFPEYADEPDNYAVVGLLEA